MGGPGSDGFDTNHPDAWLIPPDGVTVAKRNAVAYAICMCVHGARCVCEKRKDMSHCEIMLVAANAAIRTFRSA